VVQHTDLLPRAGEGSAAVARGVRQGGLVHAAHAEGGHRRGARQSAVDWGRHQGRVRLRLDDIGRLRLRPGQGDNWQGVPPDVGQGLRGRDLAVHVAGAADSDVEKAEVLRKILTIQGAVPRGPRADPGAVDRELHLRRGGQDDGDAAGQGRICSTG